MTEVVLTTDEIAALVVRAEDGDEAAIREVYERTFTAAQQDAQDAVDKALEKASLLGIDLDMDEMNLALRVTPIVASLDVLRQSKQARMPEEDLYMTEVTIPNWVVAYFMLGQPPETLKFILESLSPLLMHASLMGYLLGRAATDRDPVFTDLDIEEIEKAGLRLKK